MTPEPQCDREQPDSKQHGSSCPPKSEADKGGDCEDGGEQDEQACHQNVDEDPYQAQENASYKIFKCFLHCSLNHLNTGCQKLHLPFFASSL